MERMCQKDVMKMGKTSVDKEWTDRLEPFGVHPITGDCWKSLLNYILFSLRALELSCHHNTPYGQILSTFYTAALVLTVYMEDCLQYYGG